MGKNMSAAENIKETLHKIFMHYAFSGARLSLNHISLTKYLKLMQNCGVIRRGATNKQLEIIYCSVNRTKTNMTFKLFLDTIPKLL